MTFDKRKVNIHVYPSHFIHESRILREARALIDLGQVEKIVLLGFWKSGLTKTEDINPNITLTRIEGGLGKFEKWKWLNLVSFFFFYVKAFLFCVKIRPSIINAHSLTVLPLCCLIKLATKSKLIYDAHELETETNNSKGFRKFFAKGIERSFIRFADHVIVVSDHIRSWYQQQYNLKKIEVIKNIPDSPHFSRNTTVVQRALNLPSDAIIFLYVGALIPGRGIDLVLDAFRHRQDLKHVVFLGYGSLEQKIKAETQRTNIHLVSPVAPDQVVDYTAGAHVGISLIENSCLSYFYCLPNKVFEYIAAGIPFVCSNFPELNKEFEAHKIAWFLDSQSSLSSLIDSVTPEDIELRKANVLRSQDTWNWQIEKLKLKRVYSNL